MSDDKKPPVPQNGPRIQLQVDEAVSQGAYSNIVLINHLSLIHI